MKEVNLNFDFTDLDGNKIDNLGRLTAQALVAEVKGDPIKYFDWAMSLNKLKSVSMDESDFIKFKSLISDSSNLTILAKGQILKCLNDIK